MVTRLARYAAVPALAVLALLAAAPGPVAAAQASPAGLYLAQNGDTVSLEEAAAQVRAQTGGRILSAETHGRGNARVHRIKVLTEDNRVRIIQIDPQSGEQR